MGPINQSLLPDLIDHPLDPGNSVKFDITTNYTPAQVNQFQYMTASFVTP